MEYKKIYVTRKKEDEDIVLDESLLVKIGLGIEQAFVGCPMKNSEELDGKAIYLDRRYDWVIGKTRFGSLCCVPLKKEK